RLFCRRLAAQIMNARAALFALCGFMAGIAPACAVSHFAGAGEITAVFAPEEDPQAALVELIAQARSRIAVQAYVFTSKPLAEALIAAQRRGVTVEVLLDAKMHQRGNAAVQRLLDEGVALYAVSSFASAHDKVMVIDAATGGLCAVATGQ
ncbi:MAG: phospholipase D family protein, partial [Rhodocyclaceae bacterium]|nr:phospholipase D family protein [Rhodocyclaceae bacterium]